MISFHHIDHEQLDGLVRYSGGHRGASRILGVTPTQLQAWQRTATTPQCALRLLWLLAPEGVAIFDHDMNERLACLGRLNEALRIALAGAEAETARLRSTHLAQVQHLTAENRLLRSLLANPGLSKELGRLSAELQRIADVLPGGLFEDMASVAASDRQGASTTA